MTFKKQKEIRMNKNIIYTTLLAALLLSPSAFAASTNPHLMRGALEEVNSVAPNGGNIAANINDVTGALDAAFTPGFRITTNKDGGSKDLTQSWTCNTSGATQNAIFNDATYAYVILTNTDALPPVSSVTNIKTLAPTPASNPNAIAYLINDPPNIIGTLQTEFVPADNNWKLHLSKQGITDTNQTIPAALPYTNTFSGDDEAGRYQATVTLSLDP